MQPHRPDIDSYRMTLGEHLEELRSCLVRALVGVVVGVAVALLMGRWLMAWICAPVAAALAENDLPVRLRTLAPAEGFVTYLKVCVIWGLILAAPFSLMQVWRFVAAGLYPDERRHVRRAVPFSVALFGAGVIFFFLVVGPLTLRFLLAFTRTSFPMPAVVAELPVQLTPTSQPATAQAPLALAEVPILAEPPEEPRDGQMWIGARTGRLYVVLDGQVRTLELAASTFVTPELALAQYVTFVSWLALVFGLGFQVPILVIVLARTTIVTLEQLRAGRKYALVLLVVLAAVITPPDPASQIALAVPMYLLYELGLILAARGQAESETQ